MLECPPAPGAGGGASALSKEAHTTIPPNHWDGLTLQGRSTPFGDPFVAEFEPNVAVRGRDRATVTVGLLSLGAGSRQLPALPAICNLWRRFELAVNGRVGRVLVFVGLGWNLDDWIDALVQERRTAWLDERRRRVLRNVVATTPDHGQLPPALEETSTETTLR